MSRGCYKARPPRKPPTPDLKPSQLRSVEALGCRGLGFRVEGLGFRVLGSGSGFQDLGFGFGVQGLGPDS